VIFGAGATYDSVPSSPATSDDIFAKVGPRPPLTKHLFLDRFNAILAQYPQCRPIVPYLKQISEASSIEQELEKLQSEGREYAERFRQLAAITFYLQDMIAQTQRQWESISQGITNYRTFIDQVLHHMANIGKVCFITFNYDTMLDNILPFGGGFPTIADYVSNENFKLIKLHGSVNWAREVETEIANLGRDAAKRSDADLVNELIERTPELKLSDTFHVVANPHVRELNGKALYPAIAIPAQSKQRFECPQAHVDALKACIPEVDKMILIGWSGNEQFFLELLRDNLRKSLKIMLVTGTEEGGHQLEAKLKASGITGEVRTSTTFTDFVVHRETDSFLASG